MRLEEIDRNFAVQLGVTHEDAVLYNVQDKPFRIYGAAVPEIYRRLPAEVSQAVNEGTHQLAAHTSGVRVRFSTNSPYIILSVKMPSFFRMPHMPHSGSSGFDMYRGTDLGYTYMFGFTPTTTVKTGYIIEKPLFQDGKMRDYILNFPLYNAVSEVMLGFAPDAEVAEGGKYLYDKPVIFYGSSITQGGCASRPGNAYMDMISRRYNLDYVNLGFSGSSHGEKAMADWMADREMVAFVSDYDHNAGSAEQLDATVYPLYETVRKKHPDIPYLMISRPDFEKDYTGNLADSEKRRISIMEAYIRAWRTGDRNVYFVDGAALFAGENRDACLVDSTHPNDIGFERMANLIGSTLKIALIR